MPVIKNPILLSASSFAAQNRCVLTFLWATPRAPGNATPQHLVRGSQSVARHIRPQTRWSLNECGLVRRTKYAVPSQFSDSLLHCGEAIGGLFLGVYKVVCFTFFGLATIYNFQCQPQTAETGYVFCPCKPDVIFEDAALRYSNKQHKIPIFLISITPQVSLRYNKSIYRRKR